MKHILKFNKLFESTGSPGYEEDFILLILDSLKEYYEGAEEQVRLSSSGKSIISSFEDEENPIFWRSSRGSVQLYSSIIGEVEFTPIFKDDPDKNILFLDEIGAVDIEQTEQVELILDSIIVSINLTITLNNSNMLYEYWEWTSGPLVSKYSFMDILQIGRSPASSAEFLEDDISYPMELFKPIFKRLLSRKFWSFEHNWSNLLSLAEKDFNQKFAGRRDIYYDR